MRIAGCRQLHVDVDQPICRRAGHRLRSELPQQLLHVCVSRKTGAAEGRDPGIPGSSSKPGKQGRADASALPGVGNGHSHLRSLPLRMEADIARDADDLTARGDRDQRLMITVVDLGEVGDLAGGQPSDRGEEAPIAGLVAEVFEGPYEGRPIRRCDRGTRSSLPSLVAIRSAASSP